MGGIGTLQFLTIQAMRLDLLRRSTNVANLDITLVELVLLVWSELRQIVKSESKEQSRVTTSPVVPDVKPNKLAQRISKNKFTTLDKYFSNINNTR